MLLATLDHRKHNFEEFEKREASRAIIRKGNKLFMIYVKEKDCFIFPGGGIETGETHEETCVREALEEAGAIVEIKGYLGYIDEMWDSKYGDMTYNLKSHYYECELTDTTKQSLLGYEKRMGFVPKWVTAEEALDLNVKNETLEDSNPTKTRFLARNIYLLERLEEQTL